MVDEFVKIAHFADYIESEVAKQLLADYGIEAVATGENASNIYSIPAVKATHSRHWKFWNLNRGRSNNTEDINWPITA